MTIVEQIHYDFTSSAQALIDEVNESLLFVRPTKISDKQRELSRDYRFKYPSQLFITEEQVRNICHKYNLVLGDELIFNEEIPSTQKWQIDDFKLRKEDKTLKRKKENFNAYHYLMQNIQGNISEGISEGIGKGFATLEFAYEILEDTSQGKKIVLSLGSEFALIISLNKTPERRIELKEEPIVSYECGLNNLSCFEYKTRDIPSYHTTLIRQIKNGDSFIFDKIEIDNQLINWVDQRAQIQDEWFSFDRIPRMQRERAISLNFDILLDALDELGNKTKVEYDNITLKIVAPANKFHNTDSFVLDQGYRLIINPTPRRAIQSPFIPDPIVLQPVKGGYLILAMWGDEASIGEIQNGNNN